MKTIPYVAIHCWKALALSIVHWPSKIIFIKGPVIKLHIKLTSFTAHFPLKVLDFSQVLIEFCHAARIEICRFLQISFVDFAVHWSFQIKMFNKLAPGHIWLCAPGFKRFLHGKICIRFTKCKIPSRYLW